MPSDVSTLAEFQEGMALLRGDHMRLTEVEQHPIAARMKKEKDQKVAALKEMKVGTHIKVYAGTTFNPSRVVEAEFLGIKEGPSPIIMVKLLGDEPKKVKVGLEAVML